MALVEGGSLQSFDGWRQARRSLVHG
jgi:hypothetical protein